MVAGWATPQSKDGSGFQMTTGGGGLTAYENCMASLPVPSSEPGGIDLDRIKAIAPLADVTWSQLGGSINDASCLDTPF